MSSPTRFLVLIVAGWVGVRAAALGLLPGSEALATPGLAATPARTLPPPAATDLVPPEMATPASWATPPTGVYPAAMPYGAMPPMNAYPYPVPVYRDGPVRVVRVAEGRTEPAWALPSPRAYPAVQSLAPGMAEVTSWPLIGASVATEQTPLPAVARPARFDRFQLSTWAMMRDRPGPQSLAGTGTLGGSQAGVRMLYRFNPRLAASLRLIAPIGTARRGGDVGVGVRYAPFAHLPVAVTLERRQGFGDMGGPSGFALFAEGGVSRPMGSWRLDGYAQAGAIAGKGLTMGFADGAAVMTRPLWRNLDGGFGVWGAMQPGLSRLDAGPRLSLRLAKGIRAHADYRFKAAGNAQPGSGAVVTLAGDF